MTAASIRTRNPGAQWPSDVSKRFGSTGFEQLGDSQGNKIAIFPTYADGCAAAFYLWRSKYTGMTLASAIDKWSGHNSPAGYLARLTARTGIGGDTMITKNLIDGPQGIKLLQAQADWECGGTYPASPQDWVQGQSLAMSKSGVQPEHKGAVVAAGTAATAALAMGLSPWVVAVAVLLVGGVVYWAIKRWG